MQKAADALRELLQERLLGAGMSRWTSRSNTPLSIMSCRVEHFGGQIPDWAFLRSRYLGRLRVRTRVQADSSG